MIKMVVDVPSYIRTYGPREFFAKSDKDQNELLYKAFPLGKNSTLRAAKMRFRQKLKKKSDTPRVAKKKTVRRSVRNQSQTDQFSSLKSPPAASVHAEVATLPPDIQALVNLGPALKNIPSWMGPLILERLRDRQEDYIPEWSRPKILHPIQHEAMDAILYSNKHVIMIDGSKRRGKSSVVFDAFCEAQYNNKGLKRWFLYGATEDNAAKILRSVVEDPLFYPYTSPIMKGSGSAMKQVAYNGGRIEVMASGSERRTSGTDADVIWIDESHSVLIENPKTIAMSAMVLLANKNMKIIYTMNREGEAYEYFKNEMLNSYPPEDIAFFSFVEANCPHIDAEQDRRVRAIVKASAGEEYAAQYLDNAYVRQGGLYYPSAKIMHAYEEYEKPNMEQYDIIACGIDWGDSHDTAMFVGGLLNDSVYEEEMVYMQHPDASEIVRVITRLIREYPGIIFIWEGSPLGSFARNEVRNSYPKQRFIDSNYSKYKQNYIDNLYIYLVDEEIHLKDGKLKRQLRSFVNDKKNDDGHDALAHFLYKITRPRTQMKQQLSVISRY